MLRLQLNGLKVPPTRINLKKSLVSDIDVDGTIYKNIMEYKSNKNQALITELGFCYLKRK